MRHFRYQSRGNTVGLEDRIDDFWEIDDEGNFVRSVHLQSDGSWLKYDRQHDADRHGQLSEGPIADENLADRTIGTITFLTATEFDAAWTTPTINYPAA